MADEAKTTEAKTLSNEERLKHVGEIGHKMLDAMKAYLEEHKLPTIAGLLATGLLFEAGLEAEKEVVSGSAKCTESLHQLALQHAGECLSFAFPYMEGKAKTVSMPKELLN